jgi:hypothetical protein
MVSVNAACEVQIDGSKITIETPTIAGRATFSGTVSDDGQTITGTVLMEGPEVKEENKNSEFTLTRSLRAAPLESAKAFTGDLVVPGMGKLNMTLVFAQVPTPAGEPDASNRWVGSADVPAGHHQLPLIDIRGWDHHRHHADSDVSCNDRSEDRHGKRAGRPVQTGDVDLN